MEKEQLRKELNFKAIKSSGPGGQHVNKTASKIELSFDIEASPSLSDDEKTLLLKNLRSKITASGILILQCDTSRSQHQNKEIAIKRFFELLSKGLKVPKKRKASKPTKASIQKRLDKKKKVGLKKALRKKPPRD